MKLWLLALCVVILHILFAPPILSVDVQLIEKISILSKSDKLQSPSDYVNPFNTTQMGEWKKYHKSGD